MCLIILGIYIVFVDIKFLEKKTNKVFSGSRTGLDVFTCHREKSHIRARNVNRNMKSAQRNVSKRHIEADLLIY